MSPSLEMKLHENRDLVSLAHYCDASTQYGASYTVGAR